MSSRTWYQRAIAPLWAVGALAVGCGSNEAPRFSKGPTAAEQEVVSGAPVQLSAEATDADGDALRYAWTQEPAEPQGTFGDASAASTSWTAPAVAQDTSFKLVLRVTDPDGLDVMASATVQVRKPAVANVAPIVESTTGPTRVRAGDEVTLSATASDADGDALTYEWAQAAGQGTFSSGQTTAQAKWFSPAVGVDTDFTFNVTVRDGRGGEQTRPVTVKVTVPKYAADIQPLWNATCVGCHHDGTSGTVPSARLSLTQDLSYAALVDAQSQVACTTQLRVKKSDPASSTLVAKVEGTSCGTRMPRNNQSYFTNRPGELIRLRSWVLAGANND